MESLRATISSIEEEMKDLRSSLEKVREGEGPRTSAGIPPPPRTEESESLRAELQDR